MDEKERKSRNILKKYLKGAASEEEKQAVEAWYRKLGEGADGLNEEELIEDLLELDHRKPWVAGGGGGQSWKYLGIAASILLIFSLSIIGILNKEQSETQSNLNEPVVILPGSNKAVVTFEEGETIALSEDQEILFSTLSGLHYGDGTDLSSTSNKKPQKILLSTPIAGQYKAVLSDGTKLWLNAESSIRYPLEFGGDKRMVEVQGEVFFEVAKSDKPFIVGASGQRVEVLGTKFNIDAYGDEGSVVTTLTEGSLRVTDEHTQQNVLLAPGEQSLVGGKGAITVEKADIEEITSWIHGLHIINNQKLAVYAKKIERWYDVQMDIGAHSDKTLSSIIPRDVPLQEVLSAIELKLGVKFSVQGRRVRAMP